MLDRLEQLAARFDEVTALLSDPDVISDTNRFRDLSREYAQLEPVVSALRDYRTVEASMASAREMVASEDDPALRAMAEEELTALAARHQALALELQKHLLPKDPYDDLNIFLEVRAGTGGDEAAIFAGDLMRMYVRYAERRGWLVEILSESPGEHGGYKEVIARIQGQGAYSRLKFESGVHRVQRVPETEAQGRIHTSAATVAILPELESEEIDINPADLKIDTFRASGAGGQHVNKTESAIRITHLPSGIVVECQDERSQHKNRARAMALLKAKLDDIERSKRQSAQAAERKKLVGSGDRSERIRTYNFPQGRVTDHRINLTLYRIDDIMQGDLDLLIEPLMQAHQAELLAELAQFGVL